jgi:hypothetical protein
MTFVTSQLSPARKKCRSLEDLQETKLVQSPEVVSEFRFSAPVRKPWKSHFRDRGIA